MIDEEIFNNIDDNFDLSMDKEVFKLFIMSVKFVICLRLSLYMVFKIFTKNNVSLFDLKVFELFIINIL